MAKDSNKKQVEQITDMEVDAIWENIQLHSLLQKEKDHVEGFAPECAWVTYGGSEKLEERYCIRPTSETLFCEHYKNIIHSHRDLPKLYNQWCSVLRWEKTSRPLPAPPGVPVAGGPHHARHRGGGPGGDRCGC